MNKWMIIESQFMASDCIIEKGYLSENEAEKVSKVLNAGADSYTSYKTQMYQDETIFNLQDAKIKLQLK